MTKSDVPAGPLSGMRVLELGSFIAGPYAGQILGDYGAEVIKVEEPTGGDPMRTWGVTYEGESLWWPSIGRNKRSIALDLRDSSVQGLVRDLVSRVDIVIENFRPGRLEEWGLSYEELSRLNPAIVLVRISGFGQTGPRAHEAGFGSVGEAVGGIRYTTGSPDQPPSRAGISLGDALAAMFGVMGGLSAVISARQTGRGQVVDVAIYEAVAALMESSMADYEIGGILRGRSGSVLPGVAPSNVYQCIDGSEVLIAANADAVFARLCAAMQRLDLKDDSRYIDHKARGQNMEELDSTISEWTATLGGDELLRILDEYAVPAGRIFTARDMLGDSHYAAREMVIRMTNTIGIEVPMVGVVPKFSRTPAGVRRVGPSLGQDTYAILKDLIGLDDGAIEDLAVGGLVQGPNLQDRSRP